MLQRRRKNVVYVCTKKASWQACLACHVKGCLEEKRLVPGLVMPEYERGWSIEQCCDYWGSASAGAGHTQA